MYFCICHNTERERKTREFVSDTRTCTIHAHAHAHAHATSTGMRFKSPSHAWLDDEMTPFDKKRVNSCVLKHPLFWGSSSTKNPPIHCGNAVSDALLMSQFENFAGGAANKKTAMHVVFRNRASRGWNLSINPGPKILRSCLLHWQNASTTQEEPDQKVQQQLPSQIMAFKATASQGLTTSYWPGHALPRSISASFQASIQPQIQEYSREWGRVDWNWKICRQRCQWPGAQTY